MERQRAGAERPGDVAGQADYSVELLTRARCSLCEKAAAVLAGLADEFGFVVSSIDVDAAAAAGDPTLRAEYGDLLPVVLLNGAQHSYWEVDEDRLRADLEARRRGSPRSRGRA